MEIIAIKDKQKWDAELLKTSQPSFLQSWEWGEILIAEGKAVERLAVVEGSEALAQAQVVYQSLPFGWQYAFCPKGPVDKCQLPNVRCQIYEALAHYLQSKQCIFFRVEPLSIIHDSKFMMQRTLDINPRATTVLDLYQTEDQLMAAFHHKTRQRARRVRAEPLRMSYEKDFAIFWQLLGKAAVRHSFGLHSEKHYHSVLSSPATEQLTVFSGDTAIATTIFFGFPAPGGPGVWGGGGTYTSLFGASDYAYRNLFASYFLHWEAITRAKRRGYRYYDFFGIAPRKESRIMSHELREDAYQHDQEHPYAGITVFKTRFGGEARESPGTLDLVLQPWKYRLYQLLRRARRLI